MSQAPESYEGAVDRLEQIIERLDSGEAGLRETLDLVREGRELVDYCATELEAVGQGLEELQLDELVTSAEAARAAGNVSVRFRDDRVRARIEDQ